MTRGREHSRSGPSSGHTARSGAGQLRPEQSMADAAAQAAAAQAGQGEGGPAGDSGDAADRQPFAGTGQFTGREIPASDHVPAVPTSEDGEWVHRTHFEALAKDLAELTGDLQRMAADFDNFRKRSAREREQAARAADEKLLGELLVVLDDLERALGHAGAGEKGALAEGIRMVHGRLTAVLEQHGLTEVDTSGHFDPHLHEAMMMQPATDGVEEGQIVTVVQKGYMLGERVLRHAKVIVAG